VGPGRRENKFNHTGPQVEAENNDYHRASQGSTRHEEVASRANSSTDVEAGETNADGTSPRASNEYYDAVG